MDIQTLSQKEIYLYNIGSKQKDFRYVFNEFKFIGYIIPEKNIEQWQKLPVISTEEYISKNTKNSCVIFFDEEKNTLDFKAKLSQNLCEFYNAEDLLQLLDFSLQPKLNIKNGKKFIIWGTGVNTEYYLSNVTNYYKSEVFIDNNKEKKIFQGYEVKHPSDIDNWNDFIIIVTPSSYKEIKGQLEGYGLKENEDFFNYKLIMSLPSTLLKKSWTQANIYQLSCKSMLNHIEFSGYFVGNCCMTFLNLNLGNYLEKDLKDIWNSKLHRVMVISCLNGSYIFCNENLCPALINKKRIPKKNIIVNDNIYPDINKYPAVCNLAIDNTCNLYCESCRRKIEIASKTKMKEIEIITEKLMSQVLPHLKFITLAGDGEVFFSKIYEKIYTSTEIKNIQYIQILSNGTLFTKEKWELLTKNKNAKILFCISIDAATEETYKKLRRGGNFEKLLKALELISDLRQQGKIINFRMNFVVQNQNYKEIPAFIEMSKKYHADRVLFTRILKTTSYNDEEYKIRSMINKEGNIKPELKKILSSPICHDPIVDIGTFQGKHLYKDTDTIKNYYLWEIDNYNNLNLENIVEE